MPVAHGATLDPKPPAAVARRAGFREHHVSAGPPQGAGPVTLLTSSFRHSHVCRSRADAAQELARHDNLALGSPDGVHEINRDHRMQVGAPFCTLSARRRRVQHIRKQFRKSGRLRAVRRDRKIELGEFQRHGGSRRCPRRTADRVVLLTAARIDQRLVGLGHAPEHLFSRAIARIDARMIPARQPPIRALDVRHTRVCRQTENCVEVHETVVRGPWFVARRLVARSAHRRVLRATNHELRTTAASVTSYPLQQLPHQSRRRSDVRRRGHRVPAARRQAGRRQHRRRDTSLPLPCAAPG